MTFFLTTLVLSTLLFLATFNSKGCSRKIPKDEYFAFSNITNTKGDGSIAYILPPGLLPWIPLPITPRPTPAPLNPSTFAPEVGEIHLGDQPLRQNEFKYYRFELPPMEGISFSLINIRGSATGFYSYTNPTPNESNNNGALPAGKTTFIEPLQKYTYQSSPSVFISVKGVGIENIARMTVYRGNQETTESPPTTEEIMP